MAQMVKNLPAVQETWVQSLVRKIPWEKRMAIHSSILAWEIPWTEEPGRGHKELNTTFIFISILLVTDVNLCKEKYFLLLILTL